MDVSLPPQLEFHAAMKQSFADAARRSKDVTPDAVAKALGTLGEYDIGGVRAKCARNNIGSGFVDIGVVNADGRLIC